MSVAAGDVVIVNWRDALPKEANKRRPAIVVEDSDLFDAAYPNVILVVHPQTRCIWSPHRLRAFSCYTKATDFAAKFREASS